MPPSRVRSRLESVSIGLILFLLLFIFAGLFVIVEGLRTAMRQGLLPGAAMVAFGVFFLSIPSGALALLIYGRREARRQAERRAASPDRPWTWRNDFATGILRPEGGAETGFVTVFSLFWNAAALAGAWAGVREYRQTGDWRFLLVLLFPAVGAAFLYWAFMHTWRRHRYRKSILRLETTPVEIGGRLKGTILIPPRLDPAAGFKLTLDCLRRTRDSDNDTHDRILWEECTRVTGPVASWPEAGTAIPVSIQIPAECEAWDDAAPDRQVIWRLGVAADVPGANLEQVFEVPVFRTRPEDPARPREPLPEGFMRPSARAIAPASTRALIEGLPEGTEFVFPPAGGLRSIPAFLIALAVTVGIAWGISKAGAPLIFPLAVSAFGLIPVLAFLWSAAGEVRVLIGVRGVKLTYRLLGIHKTWKAGPGEVLEAGISVMAQPRQTPSYGILLRRRNTRPLYVLAMLADRGEAEWIASELNRRLPN
jgi:hypothetical protein